MYLIGYDIGSSSVKAALVDAESGKTLVRTQYPDREMDIQAMRAGWAEQHPDQWWEGIVQATQRLLKAHPISAESVKAIGISYQMHGLVLVDAAHQVLRPSIIWCDGRAVDIGAAAFERIGQQKALSHLLNSPGNFTASKLRWVQENEPELYQRVKYFMLPGDYIALKMTGEVCSTISGLSEGIFWDFLEKKPADLVFQDYNIDPALMPPLQPTFGVQGALRPEAAAELGLSAGIPVAYRAGDQPNNAFSLNILNPGETAATAGTSGVIYSVTDQNSFDQKSRVNAFIHVNNKTEATRNGILLCINGTGILNSWLRKNSAGNGSSYSYEQINFIAAQSGIGAEGLSVLPFGNGAERILENKDIGASFHGLNFNRHSQAHLFRAAQEGIVFALNYGFEILQTMGIKSEVIRAGYANMFLSPLFREAFVNTTGVRLERYDTDGAKGAALGAGVGSGLYASFEEAFKGLKKIGSEEPESHLMEQYQRAYQLWKERLNQTL